MPASYDIKQRIGAVFTDGSANILAFYQVGNKFTFKTQQTSFNGTPAADWTDVTISTPLGVVVEALCRVSYTSANTASYVFISDYDTTVSIRAIASIAVANIINYSDEGACITNLLSQIKKNASLNTGTATVTTSGWIDPRGKNS